MTVKLYWPSNQQTLKVHSYEFLCLDVLICLKNVELYVLSSSRCCEINVTHSVEHRNQELRI